MRITDLLDKRSINLNAAPKTKSEALDMAVELMAKSGKIDDIESYRAKVYAREEESTTGVGEGIAIPHGKCSAVNAPGLAAMIIKDGVDFESLDDEPVKVLFLIAAPDTKDNVHLDVLSKLSVLLMDENFVAKLMKAGSPEEFIEIIDGADEEAKSIDERLEKEDNKPAKILAVTSCPTGIAHTYMAAEGLEKAAAKAGCAIKIETRGSGGAKNVLTDADIESAECIIVAADAQVPMERFDGKKVIECQVSDGINKADELIKKALAGDAPVYKAGTSEKKESTSAKKGGGIGHKIYTQLMNGVSHMLPFVVGGGILIAIAFLIDGLNVDMNALSEAERSNFGTITPVAAMFKTIGGAAFGFMLPVLAGFIAMAIGDRPALALGFVGGYIAANGKSGFLGALVAGFAAGYIIVLLRKICDKLPEALEKIAPVLIYPVVETEGNPYMEGVRELYARLLQRLWARRETNQAILAVGHLQATGSEIAEKDYSERTVIGGLECVSPDTFSEKIAYTALGHIHKAQRVSGRENVRYAGSPIPMSFAEKHYHHGVVMVTLDEGCAVDIRRIECPQSIPLISVPGGEAASPEKIIEILRDLPEVDGEAPYLEVKVLLEEPEPMLRQEIEEALAGKKYRLARIVSAYRQEERVEKEADGWKKGLQEMSPLQIAQSAFEKVYQTEMPADLTDLFQEAYISATRKEEEEGE